MNEHKSLLWTIAAWWEARKAVRSQTPAQSPRWRNWLPNPGNTFVTLALLVALLWAQNAGAISLATGANSASTSTIAYQGRLANADGNPLTETVSMTFRLYDTAGGGEPFWTEHWTGSNGVQVSDGLFNVMLGSLASIPQAELAGRDALFLGISVGNDDEMVPRVQLGSVPFATQALTVPDGSITKEKLAFNPLVAGNGVVPLEWKSLTDVATIDPVGNIYGIGGDGRVEIHMPGGDTKGNLYINWHSGRSLYFGGGRQSPQMHVDPNGNLWVRGELRASGAKPAVVTTESYGTRKMYAVEAAEVRFSDEGKGQLTNGQARIQLDPIFLETIEGEYLVHLTPYGDALLYVSEIGDGYFVVSASQGNPDVPFVWRLSATRKGFVDVRLEEVADPLGAK